MDIEPIISFVWNLRISDFEFVSEFVLRASKLPKYLNSRAFYVSTATLALSSF